jgi:predicted ATP-dependent Lon-type protease
MATFKIYRNGNWDVATKDEILKIYNINKEDVNKVKVYIGDNEFIRLGEFKNFADES